MKFERGKNSARNLLFGVIAKIYNMLVPFLIRTAIIYILGMEYVGLNSLFTSILSVLNLAELGVGSALVFSMYKPLAEDDTEKICALMRLYKIYYRVIGIVILVIGMALTPALPYLVKGDVPEGMNLYILYYLNLGTTVLTYWLFAYKNCLLNVYQRNDIVNKITMVVDTVKYTLQFLVLFFTKNYYAFLIVALIMGAVSNIVTAIIVDKKYPQYKARGKLPKEETKIINRRVRDLFTSKIGSVVVDSADTIVISSFLGLTALAIYQNYFYIMNTVLGFITLITSSSLAGIGNSIITETEEKNFKDLKKLTFMFCWIGVFAVCCFACLYQPFMTLWAGKDNLLPYSMVITFCIYFFVKQLNTLLNVYKDASGIWHEDRFRPLVTAVANLAMNLIMVQFWGLYGILLSTVLSMLLVGMPWLFKNLFTTIFHFSPKSYILKIFQYVFLAVVLCAACIGITYFIDFDSLILTIILRLIVCIIVPNAVMFVIYRKSSDFKGLLDTANSITNGKLKFLYKLV
ncbi:MAG: oligosaccharide flippase family protein [Eubacterium sp.]